MHHGFFGKSFLQITGALKNKLKKLLINNISLFAYHLPLDGHPTLNQDTITTNVYMMKLNSTSKNDTTLMNT